MILGPGVLATRGGTGWAGLAAVSGGIQKISRKGRLYFRLLLLTRMETNIFYSSLTTKGDGSYYEGLGLGRLEYMHVVELFFGWFFVPSFLGNPYAQR